MIFLTLMNITITVNPLFDFDNGLLSRKIHFIREYLLICVFLSVK